MSAPSRLAELIGALSITTDLADGYRPEQSLRTAVLATALGRAHGLEDGATADVYWAATLRFLGCTAFAHEETFFGAGDDIGLRRTMGELDGGNPAASIGAVVRGVGAGRPLGARVRGTTAMLHAPVAVAHHRAQCEAGQHLGRLLGLGAGVVAALGEAFARWDGGGHPKGRSGEEISEVARVVTVAEQVALHADRHGTDAALAMARHRAGGWFDPAVVASLSDCVDVVGALGRRSAWDDYLDAEPRPHSHLTAAGLDRAAGAFARYADLKSTWTLGHSTGVGPLAEAAGRAGGLPADACARLRHAGLLHDLGRVAIPNHVWDKPGALNDAEWEQVRLHAYWSERVLARAPLLADVAAVVGGTHERPGGGGYPKGAGGPAVGQEARILAASDAFHALTEARPHRPACSRRRAADVLCADAAAGRFDLAAVRAVLDAAGEAAPAPPAPPTPAGLSDREVQVLRLVARGATNKDVARALGITAKTAAHHVAHIYAKTGCTSRAGAALFAVDHGLLGADG